MRNTSPNPLLSKEGAMRNTSPNPLLSKEGA